MAIGNRIFDYDDGIDYDNIVHQVNDSVHKI